MAESDRPYKGSHATRVRPRTYALAQGDEELLDYIANYLAVSKSDAVRTAIRSFAAHLLYLEQKS